MVQGVLGERVRCRPQHWYFLRVSWSARAASLDNLVLVLCADVLLYQSAYAPPGRNMRLQKALLRTASVTLCNMSPNFGCKAGQLFAEKGAIVKTECRIFSIDGGTSVLSLRDETNNKMIPCTLRDLSGPAASSEPVLVRPEFPVSIPLA